MSTTWLQHIPGDWHITRLKNVVGLRTERIFGSSKDEGYIGLENIEPWTGKLLLSESTVTVPEDNDEKQNIVSVFCEGDLLFGKLRPYLAKAHLARHSGICSTELLVMKPSKYVDIQFLLKAILTHEFIDQVDAETFGVRMPRADWDTISNISIPLPSLPEQRAIAAYLDHKTAKIDALIAAKERLLALLEEKRRALITYVVTHGLDPDAPMRDSRVEWIGEVPEHWEVVHLRRVLTLMDYGISESVDVQGKVAVLRMGDIADSEINYTDVGFVDEVDPQLLLSPGDLLFNRTNSLEQVGKVGIFRGHTSFPVSFASYLVRMRCGHMIMPEYLNYLLNSAPMLAWARSEALPAIGQANLNPNRYSYLLIPLPPLGEQFSTVELLEMETQRLDDLRTTAEQTIELLCERRAALIAAAVTGQLDIAENICA